MAVPEGGMLVEYAGHNGAAEVEAAASRLAASQASCLVAAHTFTLWERPRSAPLIAVVASFLRQRWVHLCVWW